ncbi:MAG: UDP-N-acetylglucosamine 2-epimerase (non-hydrolyzing) [Bacteroidota bacterium]
MTKKIIAIIGARPQFIKHAPIDLAFKKYADFFQLVTIHTGQHYDHNMSQVFFEQLEMSPPDFMLHVGSASHGAQTGRMMEKIEEIVQTEQPDGILVYGDTNSTLAGSLVGSKLHIPVIHVEAGLRSFNKKMPEEINRILTDHVSALLFVPTDPAIENLKKEGITKGVIKTGDIMYDMLRIAQSAGVIEKAADADQYYLTSIHRPYNTDSSARLIEILGTLNSLNFPVKCPLHPRTVNLAKKFDIDLNSFKNLKIIPPVSYFENMNLMANAKAVLTDSGGMQKEAYFLKKQCITLRPETEWVETLEHGWNTLVFHHLTEIKTALEKTPGNYDEKLYGTGNARFEILESLKNYLINK